MTAPKISEKSQELLIKIGLVILLYFIVAKPLFNWLGITKSKGDRIRDKELTNPNSPFKTTFWERYYQHDGNGIGKLLLASRQVKIKAMAKQIYDAFGFFSDDETAISSAFYEMKSKAEVSLLSLYFERYYSHDLLTYLSNGIGTMPQNGLGDYELMIIINYVNKLPNS